MKPSLIDAHGNKVTSFRAAPTTTKKAMGLYGSIFGYGNAGRYKYRFYTLGDNSQGIDTYSRELLVRWSREMAAQLPIVSTGIDILTQFSVGDAYLPEYRGTDAAWGKIAIDFLIQEFYPNCSIRGQSFQTCMSLFSKTIDTDGDLLQVFGQDRYGFPKFQVILSNRIKSFSDNSILDKGPYEGCIISDGVIYSPQGMPIGYCVQNGHNMVDNLARQTGEIIFSAKDAHLIYQQRYFDKCRGLPSIAPAILQAISLQELDQYEMDKAKMQSMLGYVESTPTGEAPLELQQTFQNLLNQSNDGGNSANPMMISPNDHAMKIINGPEIRYVRAEGGKIEHFATSGPTSEAQDYMSKLEIQVLSTLGVPAQLVFHPEKIGGRVTSAAAGIFRSAIRERQMLLDKRASFTCGWALAKAMQLGLIPENNEENLTQVFQFSKPPIFSLDAKYDNSITLDRMDKGICSLNDATMLLMNKTAEQTLEEQKKEQILFYTKAKEVAQTTGIDMNIVIAGWRNTPAMKTTQTLQPDLDEAKTNE